MRSIDATADQIVNGTLANADGAFPALLDTMGRADGSGLLIAAREPSRIVKVDAAAADVHAFFDSLRDSGLAAIFTVAYELGCEGVDRDPRNEAGEPLLFAALFDSVLIHRYGTGASFVAGHGIPRDLDLSITTVDPGTSAFDIGSDFSELEYTSAIEAIKERIRDGDTYQTNLTRRISARLPQTLRGDTVFRRLRARSQAPFAAYIDRGDSQVVSASPERFFLLADGCITASPIKGTRPRGSDPDEDARLRRELTTSEKDRAENVMIVDLLRNDLGKVCEYGSVNVEKLCEVESHPTLFHLVSTISGKLRAEVPFSEVLSALFPCGSITGAPKISTMNIIRELEKGPRGLSMGAIGYYLPPTFGLGERLDLSVAIRTLVVKDSGAVFRVGGGIVIDSDAKEEWQETVVKSKALLSALGIEDS